MSLFPKPRQALGQAGPGRAQIAVAEDTREDINPWGAQGPSEPQVMFAAMLCSCLAPCACSLSWGFPGTLEVQEQCVCPRNA